MEATTAQKMILTWETIVYYLIPSGLGGKLLLNYLQNKKNPVLKFDEFTKTKDDSSPIYFVRVRNTKGEGKATSCSGLIDIGRSHSRTVWANESDKCDILHDSYEDLRLFKIEYENITSPIQNKIVPKTICIPTHKPVNLRNQGQIYVESKHSFEDYKDKGLRR